MSRAANDIEAQKRPTAKQVPKMVGYPEFAEFATLDVDFLVLRRFNSLNVRALLDLQFQIVQYETELHQLDQACRDDAINDEAGNRTNSIAWDNDDRNGKRRRGAIIREVQPLLQRYNDHITSYAQTKRLHAATPGQISNVYTWIGNFLEAILTCEQEYLSHTHDLFSFTAEHKPAVQRLCEAVPLVRWMFSQKSSDETCSGVPAVVGSDRAMRWFVDTIVISLGLSMLFGPMWWLEWVHDDVKRLSIITCFVFIFATTLRIISEGRPFEVLAATAAYAAVLCVFLQKQNSSPS